MSLSLSPTVELAQTLIKKASVTPEDAGCLDLIGKRLQTLGFKLEFMPFDDVSNLWARWGDAEPLLCFAGHTDVVPTGPEDQWRFPPFAGVIEEGFLHGRGAADMKSSIAAFVTALERFFASGQRPKGSIALLLTSDEEGPSINGTVNVVETLEARGEKITWCLVGEPSSTKTVGDVVKNGRRGSLGAVMTVYGKQGHVAYPHLADNPIHNVAPALAKLAGEVWDEGNDFFPKTSFQISNIQGGTGATNVIPGEVKVTFNFRFSTEVTAEALKQRTTALLDSFGLNYHIDWTLSGQPFLTDAGDLVDAVQTAIRDVAGLNTELSTAGGTSDGRFIAPTGAQVVELGPCNATIHQVDERVAVADVDQLSMMYEAVIERLFA